MLDYKDIIVKHFGLGMSGRQIARELGTSKSGVNDVLGAFKRCESLDFPLSEGITNYGIAAKIYGGSPGVVGRDMTYLVRYLEDGRLELSNNRVERSIKPFVMGRKGWLFSNTPAGAQASAVIYSLIETAKENVLNPYRYLLWVLESAPAMALEGDAWAGMLTPANAPETCKIPKETQPNEANEY